VLTWFKQLAALMLCKHTISSITSTARTSHCSVFNLGILGSHIPQLKAHWGGNLSDQFAHACMIPNVCVLLLKMFLVVLQSVFTCTHVVSLLQAFMSRAVQQLAESCKQQGLPESAVAKKLRTRGIDLAQLQERAAEVQRGIAECASDEGWKLIQVCQQNLLQCMARSGETGRTQAEADSIFLVCVCDCA